MRKKCKGCGRFPRGQERLPGTAFSVLASSSRCESSARPSPASGRFPRGAGTAARDRVQRAGFLISLRIICTALRPQSKRLRFSGPAGFLRDCVRTAHGCPAAPGIRSCIGCGNAVAVWRCRLSESEKARMQSFVCGGTCTVPSARNTYACVAAHRDHLASRRPFGCAETGHAPGRNHDLVSGVSEAGAMRARRRRQGRKSAAVMRLSCRAKVGQRICGRRSECKWNRRMTR